MATVRAIIDETGRVVGAQFGAERADGDEEDTPSAELLPLPGQHIVKMEVPDEIEQLSGPDLSRFFLHVEVSWPATVRVPRIEVRRLGDSAGA